MLGLLLENTKLIILNDHARKDDDVSESEVGSKDELIAELAEPTAASPGAPPQPSNVTLGAE